MTRVSWGMVQLVITPYEREIYVITMIKIKINTHCDKVLPPLCHTTTPPLSTLRGRAVSPTLASHECKVIVELAAARAGGVTCRACVCLSSLTTRRRNGSSLTLLPLCCPFLLPPRLLAPRCSRRRLLARPASLLAERSRLSARDRGRAPLGWRARAGALLPAPRAEGQPSGRTPRTHRACGCTHVALLVLRRLGQVQMVFTSA